jgi:hypothetical protein
MSEMVRNVAKGRFRHTCSESGKPRRGNTRPRVDRPARLEKSPRTQTPPENGHLCCDTKTQSCRTSTFVSLGYKNPKQIALSDPPSVGFYIPNSVKKGELTLQLPTHFDFDQEISVGVTFADADFVN